MVFPISQLPREVLVYHLARQLDPLDAFNLCLAGVLPASEELYNAVFHDNTRFDEYNLTFLTERMHCRLYTFGIPLNGRLTDRPNVQSALLPTGEGPFEHTSAPLELEAVGEAILKVHAGYNMVQAVNAAGQLFTVSGRVAQMKRCLAWFNVQWRNYNPTPKDKEEGEHSILQRFNADWLARYKQHFSHAFFLTEVSSSAFSVYAVDNAGLLWEYDATNSWAVPLLLSELHGGWAFDVSGLIHNRATLLRCGRHYGTCLFEGLGIAVWRSYSSQMRAVPGKYHRTFVVPGTSTGVRDYVALDDYVMVCLWANGSVHAVYYHVDFLEYRGEESRLEELNRLGPFTQISGFGNRFALVAQDGSVVVGTCATDQGLKVELETVPGLQASSVAVGQSHFLALSKQGDVYSWGVEEDFNGCLGLGHLLDAIKLPGVRLERTGQYYSGMAVDKPIKIEVPGKVYGVFAGADWSTLLVR